MIERFSRDQFAARYAKCQAGDVVQETARLLWQKFQEYDPAGPFGPGERLTALTCSSPGQIDFVIDGVWATSDGTGREQTGLVSNRSAK
jgi:hypothetical protein